MLRCLSIGVLLCPSLAFAWPSATEWIPLRSSGVAVEDPTDDVLGASDLALEIGSSASVPAFQWFADLDDVFFRIAVMGDPTSNGMFKSVSWGVLFETDGDTSNFEYAVASSGVTAQIEAFANDGTPGVEPAFENYSYVAFLDQTDAVRSAEDGIFYFVDLRVSRTELSNHLGIGSADPFQIAAFSGSSVYASRADVAGCDSNVLDCTQLQSALSDIIVIDADGDALTDPQEELVGADPDDSDSDDDGVLDGSEGRGDADGDGLADVLDCDSDADGILDGTETGVESSLLHVDTDVSVGCFIADADTTAAPTDPSDWDTDGGNLSDGIEDWNYNGKLDPPWETDPNDPSDDLDSDGDTIADVLEALGSDGEVNDVDSDGDGISDKEEWLTDTDGDGVPNFLDEDSDGDGIDDLVEGNDDADNDGIPNYLDTDSDGDGVDDSLESSEDTDGDGAPNFLDEDSDDDGIEDSVEGAGDADQDGVPDFLDTDSDDDGIPDEEEGTDDPDGDGIPNFQDSDSDGDGLSDELETADDPDNDDIPNYIDLDSDNDGVPDASEVDGDDDCDGVPNFVDPDNDDGFCDSGTDNPSVDPYDPLDPFGGDSNYGQGSFTGGACSVMPLGVTWLPSLFLAGLTVFRRRRMTAGLALGLSTQAMAAETIGLNAQRFAPSVDGGPFVTVEDTELARRWHGGIGLWLNHANDPFVFRPEVGGEELAILGSVTSSNLVGHYSLGPIRVGVDLPVHLRTDSFGVGVGTRLGDSRVSLKTASAEFGQGDLLFSMGASLESSIPTGVSDAWVGAGTFGVSGAVLGSLRWRRLLAVANVGGTSGTGGAVSDLSLSGGLDFGAGVAFDVADELGFSAEVEGQQWLGTGGAPGARPWEWLVSARMRPTPDWVATIGGGTGLSQGVGAPDFRLVGAMTWVPGSRKALNPSPSTEEDTEETAYGHVVVRAVSPAGIPVRGAEVRIIGTVGTPLKTGRDGILEASIPPGKYQVSVAAEGWIAQMGKVSVKKDGQDTLTLVMRPEAVMIDADSGQIFLHRKVFFEVDKAELKVESLELLDDLVQALLKHEDIRKIRIEGHTDTTGSADHNRSLSNQRAEAVRSYLVRSGVEEGRLIAIGLGEDRPLQDGDSDDVHATNRRVEFHIVEQDVAE